MDALIRIEEVTRHYDGDGAAAVDGVSIQITPGEAAGDPYSLFDVAGRSVIITGGQACRAVQPPARPIASTAVAGQSRPAKAWRRRGRPAGSGGVPRRSSRVFARLPGTHAAHVGYGCIA